MTRYCFSCAETIEPLYDHDNDDLYCPMCGRTIDPRPDSSEINTDMSDC